MSKHAFPRSLIRKVEADQFPLETLGAIHELSQYLERTQDDALCRARDLGASITEIAETMQMTRQSVYNRLRQLADRKAREDAAAIVVPELETEPTG